jgi:hypothetical protein
MWPLQVLVANDKRTPSGNNNKQASTGTVSAAAEPRLKSVQVNLTWVLA